ncbi:MAG: sugar transporter [Alistipes sp.]|nr:sugar transporter [Alistipes sp.]
MSIQSRTYNSLRNSFVALVFYVVNLLLQFASRKVFLDCLGEDLLGLNSTINSILQFLNIAEMGVGTAIACTLYTPLKENNQVAINEIVSLHGWLYEKIAKVIIIGGVVLMCFFPMIFGKTSLPIGYSYLTFVVLLFGALLGYFVNYRQVLLSASQQEYKVQLSYKLVMLLKIAVQIVVLRGCHLGYVYWIIIEALFAIIAAISLNFTIRRSFPLLQTDKSQGNILRKKYPGVTTKVGQLFFHKIGTFALTQMSPIVIYAYTSLGMVAKYSNYMLVVTGLTQLLIAMFDGLSASVGNLVAEKDTEKTIKIFRELFSVRFVLVSTFSVVLYLLMEPFISLWVGENFLLSTRTLLFIVVIFYLNTIRNVVDSFIHAYGLFGDIWAPVIEASLNIGLSFLIGYYMGLDGVLLGVIISLFIIIFLWKPYYLFSRGLKVSIWLYIRMYAKHTLIFALSVVAFYYSVYQWSNLVECWIDFLLNGVYWTLSLLAMLGLCALAVEQGMRDFVNRIYRLLVRK